MHFQLFFYLKVLGTKETVLADPRTEKKKNGIINKLLILYQQLYDQWWPLKITSRAYLYCYTGKFYEMGLQIVLNLY